MICYRDRTYCYFSKSCKDGKDCFRAFTEEVEKKAEQVGLPVSLFSKKPDCFKEK